MRDEVEKSRWSQLHFFTQSKRPSAYLQHLSINEQLIEHPWSYNYFFFGKWRPQLSQRWGHIPIKNYQWVFISWHPGWLAPVCCLQHVKWPCRITDIISCIQKNWPFSVPYNTILFEKEGASTFCIKKGPPYLENRWRHMILENSSCQKDQELWLSWCSS